MNILIDIGHPAHVHYFRNLYKELINRHKIIVTCKSEPMIEGLLQHYQIEYIPLGSKGAGLAGKLVKQMHFDHEIYKLIKRENIDIAMGASASVVHAARFTSAKSISFDDDDQVLLPFTRYFVAPYADTILTPDALSFENLSNAVYYPGYQEIAYLHPKYYTPNPETLRKYGLEPGEKYFILRFVAFKAHHDLGVQGLSNKQKKALVDLLSSRGKVFITMESELEDEFKPFRMPIAPHEMHDFLKFSQMLICDGQTMCTEAALLGVPSIRCNSVAGRVSLLEEEEKKYGLTYAFLPRQYDWMLGKIKNLLEQDDLNQQWQKKRERLMNDKINVTAFWIWFIENYPNSLQDIKKQGFDYYAFK